MCNDKVEKTIRKDSIAIPLYNFAYQHHTHSDENTKNGTFFGREKEIDKLRNILKSERARGAYLITGYRGCGKTSFINHVLNKHRKSSDKTVLDVRLSLGNDSSLKTELIYKRMAQGLLDRLSEKDNWMFFLADYSSAIYILLIAVASYVSIIFNCLDSVPLLSKLVNPVIADHGEIVAAVVISLLSYVVFWVVINIFNRIIDIPASYAVCIKKAVPLLMILVCISVALLLLSLKYPLFFEEYQIPILTVISIFIWIISIKLSLKSLGYNAIRELKNLITDIEQETEVKYGISSSISLSTSHKKKTTEAPDIDHRLQHIIKKLPDNFDLIFVFDELDKISSKSKHNEVWSDNKERMSIIKDLLEKMKHTITETHARFIFIGGRDMHDEYLARTGNTSSLYKSIFNLSIYIPSLYSDNSDGEIHRINSMFEKYIAGIVCEKDNNYKKLKKCTSLFKDKETQVRPDDGKAYILNASYILRNFVHFLAFQSLGNFKQFLASLESFVYTREEIEKLAKKDMIDYFPSWLAKNDSDGKISASPKHYLFFTLNDIQRILLTSNIYISHHVRMSRRLRHADDKVVVSTMTMLQFILKFYNKSISRRNLYSMYENLTTTRPPELRSITEDLLKTVLPPIMRQARYGCGKYRFSSLFESEMRYITEISSSESAVFNFSLDSLATIKEYYSTQLKHQQSDKHVSSGDVGLIQLYMNLGNVHFWEQSFDEAINYYSLARTVACELPQDYCCSKNAYLFVESSLRLGTVTEKRHNYSVASNIYWQTVIDIGKRMNGHDLINDSDNLINDSKYYFCFQPFWSWLYLALKDGATPYDCTAIESLAKEKCPLIFSNRAVFHYKLAGYYFFANEYESSLNKLVEVRDSLDRENLSEADTYIYGRALVSTAVIKTIKYLIDLGRNGRSTEEISNEIAGELYDGKYALEGKLTPKIIVANLISSIEEAIDLFIKKGLNSNAVSSYITLFMMLGLILDSILCGDEKLDTAKLEWLKKFTSKALKKAHTLTAEVNQGAFSSFIDNFYHVDIDGLDDLKLNTPQKIISRIVEERNKETPECRIFWQRSLQGQLLNNLALRIIRGTDYLTGKTVKDLDINHFPQFGIRSYAISLSQTARYKLYQLKNKIQNVEQSTNIIPIPAKNDLFTLASDAIEFCHRATLFIRQSSGNEEESAFPIQAHVYYYMWETLFTLANKFDKIFCTCEIKLIEKAEEGDRLAQLTDLIAQELICKGECCLWLQPLKKVEPDKERETLIKKLDNEKPESEKKELRRNRLSDEMPGYFASLTHMHSMAKTALNRITYVMDPSSKVHQSIIAEKYYGEDDFDDPIFFADVAFFHGFSLGAKLHVTVIDERMKSLEEKLKQIKKDGDC